MIDINIPLRIGLEDLILMQNTEILRSTRQRLRKELINRWERHRPSQENKDNGYSKMAADPSEVRGVEIYRPKGIEKGLESYIWLPNPYRKIRMGANSSDSKNNAAEQDKIELPKKYMLQVNVLFSEMGLFPDIADNKDNEAFSLGTLYVGVNGCPISDNHTLLIGRKKFREQESIEESDIISAMEYSMLLEQIVYYNHKDAGGTIPHFHMQGVDYCVKMENGEAIKPPLLRMLERYRRTNTKEKFSVEEYPGKNYVFCGINAPKCALEAIRSLEDMPFNLIIDKDFVTIIYRDIPDKSKENPCAPAGCGLFAAYEMCGVIVTSEKYSGQRYEDILNFHKGSLVPSEVKS